MNAVARAKDDQQMELTLERSAIIAPLAAVASLAHQGLIPVLGCIRLDVEENVLRLQATNMDMWIAHKVELEKTAVRLSLCIEAQRFADFVRRLPDGATIRLSPKAVRVCQIASGESRYNLPTVPPEDFPALLTQTSTQSFRMDSKALSAMLTTARISCSTDALKPHLNGVHLRLRRDSADGPPSALCIEATDGVRLSKTDADVPDGAADLRDFIIPRQAVEYFLKLLLDGGTARIEVNERFVTLTVNGASFSSKLIDGVFPDCDRVIPLPSANSVSINRIDFLKAVERLNAFHTEKKERRTIVLGAANGKLDLSITDPSGDGKESLEAQLTGEPTHFRLNPRYLLDVLSHMEGNSVRLETNGEISPVVFRNCEAPRLLHVIMPVRV